MTVFNRNYPPDIKQSIILLKKKLFFFCRNVLEKHLAEAFSEWSILAVRIPKL